jgi:hypothetical protein
VHVQVDSGVARDAQRRWGRMARQYVVVSVE